MITLFLRNEILVKLTSSSISSDDVKKPVKAYVNSAGYDLSADESVTVFPKSRAIISTGVRMSIPKGYYGEICPRSGLAVKNGVVAFNGTIDSGYLGLVYVLLFNFSDNKFSVEKGNRIAQIIFKKCESVSFSFEDFKFDTERGVKAFGSSGL